MGIILNSIINQRGQPSLQSSLEKAKSRPITGIELPITGIASSDINCHAFFCLFGGENTFKHPGAKSLNNLVLYYLTISPMLKSNTKPYPLLPVITLGKWDMDNKDDIDNVNNRIESMFDIPVHKVPQKRRQEILDEEAKLSANFGLT